MKEQIFTFLKKPRNWIILILVICAIYILNFCTRSAEISPYIYNNF